MRVLNIHGVDDVRLDPRAPPVAGAADVVVAIKACGICGSDLSYIRKGGINRPEGGVTPIGHEAAGEVVAVGSAVKDIAVGQRVIINPMMTPSNIGSGGPEGAFCDQVLVAEARVGAAILPIPDDLPYEVAALAEPLAVALHGVNRTGAKPGDKVAVFGCGPIGLAMVLWLVDRGITDVIAIDLADERLARARAMGARATINAASENVRERLAQLHGTARALFLEQVGTDVFMDAAGGPGLVNQIISMGKSNARLVVTAAYSRPVEISLGMMLINEMSMTTALGYPTEIPEVVAALPRLRDKVQSLISHRYRFEDVLEGLKVAGTPQSAKVMVAFDAA
ncbi:zinc-binding dehydrogenase [Novosphingobium bradum]|uniref:Zinc-binding dehydrogenase n=1 Tax=Novosphingobium bradum TaxID=1737444 RepID=A0ABV7IPM8_9SPHN